MGKVRDLFRNSDTTEFVIVTIPTVMLWVPCIYVTECGSLSDTDSIKHDILALSSIDFMYTVDSLCTIMRRFPLCKPLKLDPLSND